MGLKDIELTSLTSEYKHTREVTKDDNYFIVKVQSDNSYMEIGWIEEYFDENKFREIVFKDKDTDDLEILSLKQVSKEEYNEWKELDT